MMQKIQIAATRYVFGFPLQFVQHTFKSDAMVLNHPSCIYVRYSTDESRTTFVPLQQQLLRSCSMLAHKDSFAQSTTAASNRFSHIRPAALPL
eukprot:scaffold66238_cov43-Cyclotella_meneghiniana.AAC.3